MNNGKKTVCSEDILKKYKTHPSALLSYISTREFLRTREKCIESRTSQVFFKIPKCLYNSTMHKDEVFYFFYKMLRKSPDVSSVHYNTIKHACDVSRVLYGAIWTRTDQSQRVQLVKHFIMYFIELAWGLYWGNIAHSKFFFASLKTCRKEQYSPIQTKQASSIIKLSLFFQN